METIKYYFDILKRVPEAVEDGKRLKLRVADLENEQAELTLWVIELDKRLSAANKALTELQAKQAAKKSRK